ncbi:3D domain-containing protein [Alicyclobacillus fastidiosus]|uniref:3D domain-containing protein n=1 Tax=Alicyclobacillus fastidiosus TaxID=392011 RepID=A0ABV5ADX0_9BACL|nr:3D domain-containing protein [Alicyclobacillus fastidiosus]WEH08528.1 3D domain-containing protein [Alicyclobacillus fastidiosus]
MTSATGGTPIAFAHVEDHLNLSERAVTVGGRAYDLSQYHPTKATFLLTAYNLDRRSTGKSPGEPGYGITSTGTFAATGRTVAVDPHVIPYGSLLYIDGIGWRVAEDTGGAIRGHHIDVLVDSRQRALQFGVKHHCEVEVYTPVEPQRDVRPISNSRFHHS